MVERYSSVQTPVQSPITDISSHAKIRYRKSDPDKYIVVVCVFLLVASPELFDSAAYMHTIYSIFVARFVLMIDELFESMIGVRINNNGARYFLLHVAFYIWNRTVITLIYFFGIG